MRKAPERIGKFRIVGTLGRGGMGDVYKGVQEPLNRVIALKILPEEYSRNEEFLTRFITEAKAISLLEHQNIVGIYDYGVENEYRYIAMRYIEGVNLAERIAKAKKLDISEALDITRQICRALKYAHEREILHRDIKPQNILLSKHGQVFVTDFGIAKLYESTNVTRTGVVVGTPEYMSPEQAEGRELNPQTDIYSLGIVLFEMLTGDPPFTGDNPLSIAYKHVNVQPPLLSEKRPGMPKRLELIVLKALKKDRAARYRDIDEFLCDLDRMDDDVFDPETRDMEPVPGRHSHDLFDSEKRVVDRRGGERRRESRRSGFRRGNGSRRPSWPQRILVWLILATVLSGAVLAVRTWLFKAGAEARPTPAVIENIVGKGFPERALDDNVATCWVGEEQGAVFSFTFGKEKAVNRVDVMSGDHGGTETFGRAGRPARLKFTFEENAGFEASLEDSRERQVITFPSIYRLKKVRVEVLSTFPGSDNGNPCISELKFWLSPNP